MIILPMKFDREADESTLQRVQPLRVALFTRGNPDLRQDPSQPLPGIPNRFARVSSLQDARQRVRSFIEQHGLGAGNWAGGQVLDGCDQQVAAIGYNGRVWLPAVHDAMTWVSLGDRFEEIVSMGVSAGVLCLDPDPLPADAALRGAAIANDLPQRAAGKPLFELGRVVMTPGVEDLLDRCPRLINRCLAAYTRGDWGVSAEPPLSDEAVRSGEGRLFAAYPIDPARPSRGYGENTVWVITEADRSVTTLLLPEEY
jgi:hypothetical protein